MEAEAQRVPLDEVGRLVGHRFLKKARLQEYAREGRAEELLDLAAADGIWDDRAAIRYRSKIIETILCPGVA